MNVTADALNSALVHSLWQDAVVGLLLWGTLVVLRHSSANARYLAACAALAVMAALPIVTTIVLSERASGAASSLPATVFAAPPADDTLPLTATSPAADARSVAWLASLKPWLLPIWLAGVTVCSLRLVMAGLHTVVLRRRSDPEHGPVASTVAALAARIGVGRPVSVRISLMTDTPATLGVLRPVILLPPAVALGVTPQQLEALLAHELAHIRRHDYLVNVLQMLTETLFFYHPVVWWASKRIRIERELCCDDIAVGACGDAVGYAQALTRVARLQFTQPGMMMGATGGAFLQRIQRLLGVASASKPVSPLWLAAASVVLIVAVMFTGSYAQSQSPGTLAPVSATDDLVLRGRVVDASSGQPVPGARVRAQYITGVENPLRCPIGDCGDVVDAAAGRIPIYLTTAGKDGRFDIRGVKPGDYLVAAVASAYAQRYFGQTSSDMPEMTVHVAAGQRAPSIDIRLEPTGSVAGHVFSDKGEGLPGVEVELLRRTYVPGGAQPIPVAFAQTEDMGLFTFRNVTAGEYYVRAYVPASTRPTRGDESLSYVATLFPDATDVAFARPVVVGSGQELLGVDFALATARTRVVNGRLIDPAGASVATARVQLLPRRAGTDILHATATARGQFRFADVPSGDYMLTVIDTSNARSWNTAVHDISVFDDVTDLVLVAGPRVSIDGRIVHENSRPLPFDPRDLQIFTEQRISELGIHSAGFAKVGADGTFSLHSGTGMMAVRIVGMPPRWFVKAMQLDGVDVTDRVFELTPGDRRRLDITLTDRVGRLSGIVTDRSARPISNALVVIFPEDRARWNNARSMRTTFSHQQGRYELDALPISSYRAVAVTALPRDAWTDPAVLARLWPASSSVSLDELGRGTLHLRVVAPPADLIQ
jgi:beta-lactamase regulating signal transducer with metallopeptidase domain